MLYKRIIMNDEDKKLNKYIRLKELIKKSIEKPYEENDELIELLSQNRHAGKIIDFLTSEQLMRDADKRLKIAYEERDEDELLKKIWKLSARRRSLSSLSITIISTSITAALLIISLVVYNSNQAPVHQLATVIEANHYVRPTLIISGKDVVDVNVKGDKIILDNFTESNITQDSITQCRLIIPHGQVYTVELSDGTNVTLNANSELIYPSEFTSDVRLVEVKGEVFFDVKKSTVPFIVKANDSHIMVYGTTFNVNTRDIAKTKVLLLTGSIGFSTPTINKILLEPNQMIVAGVKTNEFNVVNVTNNYHTAWLTNYFVFYEAPMSELLEVIKDWYNVDFEYSESQFKNVNISFSINRPNTINEMFEFIEDIMNVKFKEMKGGIYRIERRMK